MPETFTEDQLHTALIAALLHPLLGAQRKKKVIQQFNRARKAIGLEVLEAYDVKKIAVAVAKSVYPSTTGCAFVVVKSYGVESWKITNDALVTDTETENL